MFNKIRTFLKRNALTVILAILPPILIWFLLQKESIDLSVTVTSKTSVVSLNSNFSDGVEVFHNKKPINGLFVADIRIKNEGNRPIEKSDFDTPLKIKFNGKVIKPVKLVSTEPSGLPVDASVVDKSIVIKPLLINPEDIFNIQVKVINPTDNELIIEPSARIRAIKKLTFNPYSDTEDPWYSFILGIIASLLAVTSLVSSRNLFQKFKLVSISLTGVTLELTKELEANQKISQRMEALADKLSISGHDFKNNILLLRLKIESQLRELVKLNNLKVRNIGSVSFLTRELMKENLIDKKVVALIRDITPAINRELHESESYLSAEEFETLQHAALSVIASLEESLG